MYIYSIVFCVFIIGQFNNFECLSNEIETGPKEKQCGISEEVDNDSLGGGENRTFPWHARFYKRSAGEDDFKQICAGTLITDQFVLLPAYCVANANLTEIRVALGKNFPSWDHNEPNQQKRNVSKVSFPQDYEKRSYMFDYGLILLDEKVKSGGTVMPACTGLRTNSHLNEEQIGAGQLTKIQRGSMSSSLRYNNVKIVPKSECRQLLPPSIPSFDKFCTIENNTNVPIFQPGDSGGVTLVQDGLHYIYGVASFTFKSEGAINTFITNITFPLHASWIENELRKVDTSFSWFEKGVSVNLV